MTDLHLDSWPQHHSDAEHELLRIFNALPQGAKGQVRERVENGESLGSVLRAGGLAPPEFHWYVVEMEGFSGCVKADSWKELHDWLLRAGYSGTGHASVVRRH